MVKISVLLAGLAVSFFSFVYFSQADEVPVVNGIIYTQEKGSVGFSDGSTKTFVMKDMGCQAYEQYFSNIKVGKPEPVLPARKIRFIATSVKSNKVAPPVVEDLKIEK